MAFNNCLSLKCDMLKYKISFTGFLGTGVEVSPILGRWGGLPLRMRFSVGGGLLVERLWTTGRLTFLIRIRQAQVIVCFEAAIPTAFEAIERINGVTTSASVASSISIAGLGNMAEPSAIEIHMVIFHALGIEANGQAWWDNDSLLGYNRLFQLIFLMI